MSRMPVGKKIDVFETLVLSGHKPSTAWLNQFVEMLGYRLRHLRPCQLAILLRCFSELCYCPTEDFMLEVDRTCCSHPGPFDPKSTTEVVDAMAALYPNCRFPTFAYIKVERSAETFSYEQLVAILRAFTQLKFEMDDNFLEDVGRHLSAALMKTHGEERTRALQFSRCF